MLSQEGNSYYEHGFQNIIFGYYPTFGSDIQGFRAMGLSVLWSLNGDNLSLCRNQQMNGEI